MWHPESYNTRNGMWRVGYVLQFHRALVWLSNFHLAHVHLATQASLHSRVILPSCLVADVANQSRILNDIKFILQQFRSDTCLLGHTFVHLLRNEGSPPEWSTFPTIIGTSPSIPILCGYQCHLIWFMFLLHILLNTTIAPLQCQYWTILLS